MNREELKKAGYIENSEIECPHGGHEAILFVHQETGDTKTFCPKEDMTI